jgi:hypothetical protein
MSNTSPESPELAEESYFERLWVMLRQSFVRSWSLLSPPVR